MKPPTFTNEQMNFICYMIGEWYLLWKNKLVDYNEKTHRLGFAKEQLKEMICDPDFASYVNILQQFKDQNND